MVSFAWVKINKDFVMRCLDFRMTSTISRTEFFNSHGFNYPSVSLVLQNDKLSIHCGNITLNKLCHMEFLISATPGYCGY